MPEQHDEQQPSADAVAAELSFLPQEYVARFPIGDLRDLPGNPKEHDLGAIMESMAVNGFAGVIIAQKSTGYVIAGHGTRDSAREKRAEAVPVLLVDCDDATATRLCLAFNRLPERGGFNIPLLADMLARQAELRDLAGTGYSPDDVDDILALTRPIDFGSIAADPGAPELPYKAAETILVHVKNVTALNDVQRAIAALLAEHADWEASVAPR